MKNLNLIIQKKNFISKSSKIKEVYDIDPNPIGKGTFGVVLRVIHKVTKQVRAAKSIAKAQIADMAKFKMEIEILRSMDHPNIVKLFEWFEDEVNLYLIMEYCSGGELFEMIEKKRSFSEEDAKIIFKQMMNAISYLHSKNIVHRDLKPENLVFESKNPDETLKLIDFGLSKMYKDPKSGEVIRLRTMAGSTYYVAPEVLTGNYTVACDIWSCGVILFILFAGYPPFLGDTDKQVLENVIKGKIHFDEAEWSKVSKQAKDLILRILTKVSERPTAVQVLNDPWFKEKGSSKEVNLTIIKNLSSYRNTTRLQKAILAYMATQCNEAELSKMRNQFLALDLNHDGHLSFEEFASVFKGEKTSEEIKEIMDSIDIDKSGCIDYTEFLASTLDESIYLQEEKLINAFNAFDVNKKGKIIAADLKAILGTEMGDIPDKVWEELINEADLDGDNKLDFNEFMKLMYSYKGSAKSKSKK